MGTRGLRVVRFHKRYYVFYNHWDSYPTGLGKDIVGEIPADAAAYQAWLEGQRKQAAEWESVWAEFLTVVEGTLTEDLKTTKDLPSFMQENSPSLLPPLNDTFIEYVYTIDLGLETFSVNNSAHFKLHRMPHIDWTDCFSSGELGDTIILPGSVPMDAITSLVASETPLGDELSKFMEHVSLEDDTIEYTRVSPKDVKDIPWRQRHGPIIQALTFFLWSRTNEDTLAASLFMWSVDDLPFREYAFAALCLAAGGRWATTFVSNDVSSNGVYGYIGEASDDPGLISCLTAGAHIEGHPPGSSPQATVYWLEGVLVFLVAKLYDDQVFVQSRARVARYCEQNFANQCIDAVLISVEHVVLVHIIPGESIQETGLLPLFNIANHVTMTANERYSKKYLEKIAGNDEGFLKMEAKKRRKANQERMLKNEGMNIQYGDDDDEGEGEGEEEIMETALYATQVGGSTLSTFYALVHLFEAVALRRMPPAKVNEGRLPNEIYTNIIRHITDAPTRESCMGVSRTFRRISQENTLFADSLLLEPCIQCQDCTESGDIPSVFATYDVATKTHEEVTFAKAGGFLDYGGEAWRVAMGKETNRKSFLSDVSFRLPVAKNRSDA